MNQGKSIAALTNADGVEIQVEPINWAAQNTPALAAQASATKAAVAGVVHVCTGILASIACGVTAQTPITVRLRDGATGVGNILLEQALSSIANGSALLALDGLSIAGTPGNAMTLEFSGAGVAASQECVTLCGYDLTQ